MQFPNQKTWSWTWTVVAGLASAFGSSRQFLNGVMQCFIFNVKVILYHANAWQECRGLQEPALLRRALSYLDVGGSMLRMLFIIFYFSSTFNTIQLLLLHQKVLSLAVDPHLVNWMTDYLTKMPQFVRMLINSTGAPQGTVLSPRLFSLYTTDFQYTSDICHMQTFSDDSVIVACIKGVGTENAEAWCRTLWSRVGGIMSIWTFRNQRRWCWTSAGHPLLYNPWTLMGQWWRLTTRANS